MLFILGLFDNRAIYRVFYQGVLYRIKKCSSLVVTRKCFDIASNADDFYRNAIGPLCRCLAANSRARPVCDRRR